MSLRVLLCAHSPADARTAVYRSQLIRAADLRRQGAQVDVITPDDLMTTRIARLDPFLLPVKLAFRRLTSYDVVVFHSYLGWAFHLLRPCLDPKKRVGTITAFHGLEPLYAKALAQEAERGGTRLSWRFRLLHAVLAILIKHSCRRSDAVFCLNSMEADYLVQHRWADSDRIYLMVNGVEPECFVARKYNASPRRILFIGQWLPAKGTRYLVDAFVALTRSTDVTLACVGTRVASDAVLASFPEAVRGRIAVMPDVTRAELHEQLRQADLFVFPSLSEGFSFALLEAMAAALPVVATPAGAALDILVDGSNALLVPIADVPSIVGAVQRLLTDTPLRERLGRAAQGTARRYTLDVSAAKFTTAISAIVDRRSAGHVNDMRTGEDVIS